MTTCYHTTGATEATSILNGGFRNNTENHPLFGEITGVYLGEEPLSDGVGLPIGTPSEKYSQVLRVQFNDGYDLDRFHLCPGRARVWHLPASEINAHATVTLLSKQSGSVDESGP